MDLDELHKWKMLYNRLDREERFVILKAILQTLVLRRFILKPFKFSLPLIYRIHYVFMNSGDISFSEFIHRLLKIYALASVPLLYMGFSGIEIEKPQLVLLLAGNFSITVALDSIFRMADFIYRYLRK